MLLWPPICPACLTRAESTPVRKILENKKGEERNIRGREGQKVRTNRGDDFEDGYMMMGKGYVEGEREILWKERIKQ